MNWAQVQNDLLQTFYPVLVWFLIGMLLAGIGLAIWINVLHATRGMMDRFKL